MELFVCIKSVPAGDTISFDEKTGNLRRTGSAAMLNPVDLIGIEAGLRCAEEYGGKVSVVSMGPPSAETGLRTALAMGVSAAYLLCDRIFAGADVLATAYTLAAFFRSRPRYDIIFCGKHSTDGDTGQTGTMLAEFLDIPHACGVCAPVSVEEGRAIVRQRLDVEYLSTALPLPCLVIMENDAFYPRDTTLSGILQARHQVIQREDSRTILPIDPLLCGSRGSATKVTKLFVPKHSRQGRMLSLHDLEPLRPILTKEGVVHG
jgi:electron transfer flavoprotein beta subunit